MMSLPFRCFAALLLPALPLLLGCTEGRETASSLPAGDEAPIAEPAEPTKMEPEKADDQSEETAQPEEEETAESGGAADEQNSPTADDADSSSSAESDSAVAAAGDEQAARPVVSRTSRQREPAPERRSRFSFPGRSSGSAEDITFDDIKFDMEKGAPFKRELLTEEIEQLEGETIRIRGYILPSSVFQQSGFDRFVLVRDNQECCFGPGAALYDCIVVKMAPGKTADFSTRPVAVEGEFQVKELMGPDGKHLAIYEMQGHAVE